MERLGVLYCAIISTNGECDLDVGRGDQLIFSENIVIFISSSGDKEDAVGRGGVPFYLVCTDANVDNEGGKGFNLPVPLFGKRRADVGVGG